MARRLFSSPSAATASIFCCGVAAGVGARGDNEVDAFGSFMADGVARIVLSNLAQVRQRIDLPAISQILGGLATDLDIVDF